MVSGSLCHVCFIGVESESYCKTEIISQVTTTKDRERAPVGTSEVAGRAKQDVERASEAAGKASGAAGRDSEAAGRPLKQLGESQLQLGGF